MKDWKGLGATMELIGRCQPAINPHDEFRIAAAKIAVRVWGLEAGEASHPAVNVGGLYLSQAWRVVHELSPSVRQAVDATDLWQYPDAPPVLLERAGIIESKRPGEPLFGATSSLGWYWLEGKLFLVGIHYPDGASAAATVPLWPGTPITGHEGSYDDLATKDAVDSFARAALRFLIIYGLLLEAEGSPVRLKPLTGGAFRAIVTEGVLLTAMSAQITVRGHLRHQAYGPRHSLRKWIWIAEHAARRWIAPGT